MSLYSILETRQWLWGESIFIVVLIGVVMRDMCGWSVTKATDELELKVIKEQGNYDGKCEKCKFRVYFRNYVLSGVIVIMVRVLELEHIAHRWTKDEENELLLWCDSSYSSPERPL